MLEFFQATTSFNLPPVRQCGRKGVCKCDEFTCLNNWWTTRGDSARLASSTGWSARGTPSSKKSFLLIISVIGGTLFQKHLYSSLLLLLVTSVSCLLVSSLYLNFSSMPRCYSQLSTKLSPFPQIHRSALLW